MGRLLFCATWIWLCALSLAQAGTDPATNAQPSREVSSGKVLKVLPHLLDLEGRHSLSPSLYERDAYQAFLRAHPKQRSGVRFDVLYKAKGPLDPPLELFVEARGSARGDQPKTLVLKETPKAGGWFGHWVSFTISGDTYKDLGDVTAWRVSLWVGDQMLDEQKSFLW